jgi:predicted nucleic acid-binding protein
VSFVIDADVLIGVLRDVPGAHQALAEARLRDPRLLSVTLVRVEILRGMHPGEEHATKGLLDQIDWLTVDIALADRAGEFGRTYRHSHQGIDPIDLLLAAAAERYSAQLLTRNVRHFPMIPGLRPAY